MSALASLVRAYDRMATRGEIPPYGYSQEKIGFVIPTKSRWERSRTRRSIYGKAKERRRRPRLMAVPRPSKRTSGIEPKPSSMGQDGICAGRDSRLRVSDGRARIMKPSVVRHRERLADMDDDGLLALLRFLDGWMPINFPSCAWPEDMKDQKLFLPSKANGLTMS